MRNSLGKPIDISTPRPDGPAVVPDWARDLKSRTVPVTYAGGHPDLPAGLSLGATEKTTVGAEGFRLAYARRMLIIPWAEITAMAVAETQPEGRGRRGGVAVGSPVFVAGAVLAGTLLSGRKAKPVTYLGVVTNAFEVVWSSKLSAATLGGGLPALAHYPSSVLVPADFSPVNADPIAQLRELSALHDEGVVSDTEFDEAKARLLGRLDS